MYADRVRAMNLNSSLTRSIAIFALAVFCPENVLRACPSPQGKPSRSDEDINAIGHRDVGKGMNLYSLEKEKKLGEQLAREVERSSKILDDLVVTEYINRIAQKVAQNSDARLPISIRVIDSDEPNAFTLPGGFQYINTGLILHTEGEGELASVLARGVAHIAMRSSTMEATKGELMQLATIPLISLGPGGWASYGTYNGLNLAMPLTYLKFHRDAERAADFFGLQYLYKAGYDPNCLVQFLERGSPQSAKGKVPQPFSLYPPLPERVENMKKEIARILPHRDAAIVTTAEFQEIKARLLAQKANQALSPERNPGKPTLRKPGETPPSDPPILMPDCE
jgi:predicted Zn-dependent protease